MNPFANLKKGFGERNKTYARRQNMNNFYPLPSHQNTAKLAKSMCMHETGCQSWNCARAKLMRKSSGARASAQQLNRSSAHPARLLIGALQMQRV
jgi:hypothetical protein